MDIPARSLYRADPHSRTNRGRFLPNPRDICRAATRCSPRRRGTGTNTGRMRRDGQEFATSSCLPGQNAKVCRQDRGRAASESPKIRPKTHVQPASSRSPTRSAPARRTPRTEPSGKGPPTGPGARADGPAPHTRTPAPLWGPFPGQRAQRVFGHPPRAQSRQIRQRRRPAPSAGAIDAKKSALQAAASTASARAPVAPHGPGE